MSVSSPCWKAMVGYALYDHNTKSVPDVLPSVCMTMCEEETEFLCLSADYSTRERACHLSSKSSKTAQYNTHPENIYYERIPGCTD